MSTVHDQIIGEKPKYFNPSVLRLRRSSEALLSLGIKVFLVVFRKMRKQIENNGIA